MKGSSSTVEQRLAKPEIGGSSPPAPPHEKLARVILDAWCEGNEDWDSDHDYPTHWHLIGELP